ncbi:MAG: hypothetical protein ACD_49C00040G0002 [uncultured bacterium (gcode 4)]|uniref:Uncharacterized protein n=1 Tax=uncultured bacterium (gcode 4) TaxID=1234023 RepID=K2AXG7_9BACT|nr:MAG: hypothetical protein ACD_49C00040G0002 [uncultured bacterium (gcode 4)]
MNNINKIFLKIFLELRAKLYHKNDENIRNYKKFKFDIDKEILVNELNICKNNTNFLIKTDTYQRFDNYWWDWDIFIKLTNNYEEKFEQIFQEKTKLLDESILIEQEILDFKLDNFEDYYIYKYNDEKEHKDMQRKITKKSKGNVIFEWLEKDIISKKELKSILELQIKLLKKKSINILKKDINSISFEFEFLTFHNNNPFYWNLLDIYDFILDFDFFKKDFYKDCPIIKDKKRRKIDHYDFIKNFVNHRFTRSDYNDYYLLACPVIDIIQDIEKQHKLLNKSKNNNIEITGYIWEELEELNKTLEIYNLKKKENKIIEKCFFKEDEVSRSYILTKWNAKNLTKAMGYSLKDKFSLTDNYYKKIKKSKFEISIKFLTY